MHLILQQMFLIYLLVLVFESSNAATICSDVVTTSTANPTDIPDINLHLQFAEYQVRITDLDKSVSLMCKSGLLQNDNQLYTKRYSSEFDGQSFELYQREYLKWIPGIQNGSLQLKGAVMSGFTSSGSPLYTCRLVPSHKLGTVSLDNGLCHTSGTTSGFADFEILTISSFAKYTWTNVTDWTKEPIDGVLLRHQPAKVYLGRVKLPTGHTVLPMPQEVTGQVAGSVDQVLTVSGPESYLEYQFAIRLDSGKNKLICGEITEILENKQLEKVLHIKIDRSGDDADKTVEFELFKKEPIHLPLVWVDGSMGSLPVKNPILAGIDPTGTPLYICRGIDSNLQNGWTESPEYSAGFLSVKTGKCSIPYGGKATRYDHYQVLTNPEQTAISWKAFNTSKPFNNGYVIGSRDCANVYFISKIESAGRLDIGKLNPVSGEFYYLEGDKEKSEPLGVKKTLVLTVNK